MDTLNSDPSSIIATYANDGIVRQVLELAKARASADGEFPSAEDMQKGPAELSEYSQIEAYVRKLAYTDHPSQSAKVKHYIRQLLLTEATGMSLDTQDAFDRWKEGNGHQLKADEVVDRYLKKTVPVESNALDDYDFTKRHPELDSVIEPLSVKINAGYEDFAEHYIKPAVKEVIAQLKAQETPQAEVAGPNIAGQSRQISGGIA